MKILPYFAVSLAALAGLLSASAEKIDLSDAPVMPDENEIWFRVDGIDYSAIKGESTCAVRDAGYELFQAESGGYAGKVTVPPTVTEEGVAYTVTAINAFSFCPDLEAISLPNTIKEIEGIQYLPLLESLEIPEGVEIIKGCSALINLHHLTLPSNPMNVDDAFINLPALKTVTIKCTTPYTFGEYTFAECQLGDCTLIVPENAKEAYREAKGWNRFGIIYDTKDISSVNSPAADSAKIRLIPGGVAIEGYRGTATVYSADGAIITITDVRDHASISLNPGMYIVTLTDGITFKIRIA